VKFIKPDLLLVRDAPNNIVLKRHVMLDHKSEDCLVNRLETKAFSVIPIGSYETIGLFFSAKVNFLTVGAIVPSPPG
jgi:hypothetical protein